MPRPIAMKALNRISEHIYALPPDPATDRPVLGAVVGRRATLMVEAGNSPAHAQLLLAGLAQVTSVPLRYVVLTHWHWDHVFGASAFAEPVFAHRPPSSVASITNWSRSFRVPVTRNLELRGSRISVSLNIPVARPMYAPLEPAGIVM